FRSEAPGLHSFAAAAGGSSRRSGDPGRAADEGLLIPEREPTGTADAAFERAAPRARSVFRFDHPTRRSVAQRQRHAVSSGCRYHEPARLRASSSEPNPLTALTPEGEALF